MCGTNGIILSMNVSQDVPNNDVSGTAYHEAGHAVIALYLGRPIQRVSIQPGHLRLGECQIQRGSFKPSKDQLETEILILLSGAAAEARYVGRYDWGGAIQDMRGVNRLVEMRAGGPRQIDRLKRRMLDKTEYLLDQPGVWAAIELVAKELLQHTIISGRAARHFFDQAVTLARKNK